MAEYRFLGLTLFAAVACAGSCLAVEKGDREPLPSVGSNVVRPIAKLNALPPILIPGIQEPDEMRVARCERRSWVLRHPCRRSPFQEHGNPCRFF
jgi:hypothetical protein